MKCNIFKDVDTDAVRSVNVKILFKSMFYCVWSSIIDSSIVIYTHPLIVESGPNIFFTFSIALIFDTAER